MPNDLPGSDQFHHEIQSLTASNPFDLLEGVRAAARRHFGSDYHVSLQPFGVTFARRVATEAAGGISTTKTVCATISIPPDADSDPEDTD
ncbi:MAG TPA: hypothetical protein VGI13_04570 [Candidatus Acidoferrum sp.]